MHIKQTGWLLVAVASGLVGGCNGSTAPSAAGTSITQADSAQYLLTGEPAGAQGVIDLRKQAKDGDEVTVIGRVGGSTEPIVKGRVAFTLVDTSLVPCSERAGDDCKTPWDYCCDGREELARATLMIKLVDGAGKTLAQDAEAFLGVKPLQTLVVCGRAKRDSEGNLTVLASKLYRKP